MRGYIMALNIFLPSTTGMEAQAHALGQVSTNIANMNTVGYKSNETMFYSLLGAAPVVKSNQSGLSSSRVDIQGVGYYDRTNIEDQGVIYSTGNNYDVAINNTGNAFFMVKDAYNNTFYTRAGNFTTRTENGEVYLVSQNGLKAQGFPRLSDGSFGAAPEDLIIKYPEKIPPVPTTEATITANVPAIDVDSSSYGITIYSPNHNGETMNMIFKKVEGKVNTWALSFDVEGGTVTSDATEVVFDSSGNVVSPKTFDVSVNWDDGDTNSIHMDISNMTQLDAGTGVTYVKQDGAPEGNFVKSYIGEDGIVEAYYSNGDTYISGKLALVGFTAPNNLTPYEGTLFQADSSVGESFYVSDNGYIVPQSLESSSVNVEEEFSRMIITQRAYSSNANAFTTADEMLQTAVNLKT